MSDLDDVLRAGVPEEVLPDDVVLDDLVCEEVCDEVLVDEIETTVEDTGRCASSVASDPRAVPASVGPPAPSVR